MSERVPVAPASSPAIVSAATDALPGRNRRTALLLVAWIVLLVLASALVAWLRN